MKFFLLVLLLFASMSSFGITIDCRVNDEASMHRNIGVTDNFTAHCGSFEVELSSIGVEVELVIGQTFSLTFPFRSKYEIAGTYVGIKAEAMLLLGAKVGVFTSTNKGCIMHGFKFGFVGAMVHVGVLRVRSYYDDDDY